MNYVDSVATGRIWYATCSNSLDSEFIRNAISITDNLVHQVLSCECTEACMNAPLDKYIHYDMYAAIYVARVMT